MKKSSFLLLSLASSLVIANPAPAATPVMLINHTGHTVNVNYSHCREVGSFCTYGSINQIQATVNDNSLVVMAPMGLDRLFINQVTAMNNDGKVIAQTESACSTPSSATTVNLMNDGNAHIVCQYSHVS